MWETALTIYGIGTLMNLTANLDEAWDAVASRQLDGIAWVAVWLFLWPAIFAGLLVALAVEFLTGLVKR